MNYCFKVEEQAKQVQTRDSKSIEDTHKSEEISIRRRYELIIYPCYPCSSSNINNRFLSRLDIVVGDVSKKDQTNKGC